jgi:hypothetical protein
LSRRAPFPLRKRQISPEKQCNYKHRRNNQRGHVIRRRSLIRCLVNQQTQAVEERNILEEMGHPQPPTPIQTDNSMAEGIINKKVQPKCTKAMVMQFHWLRNSAINQHQFRFYWRPGPLNYADYWTKQHPPAHSQGGKNSSPLTMNCRSFAENIKLNAPLQGCVRLTNV